MDASASPLNPYVAIDCRSENSESFEVVKRSQRMGRSVFCVYDVQVSERDASKVLCSTTYAYPGAIVCDLE